MVKGIVDVQDNKISSKKLEDFREMIRRCTVTGALKSSFMPTSGMPETLPLSFKIKYLVNSIFSFLSTLFAQEAPQEITFKPRIVAAIPYLKMAAELDPIEQEIDSFCTIIPTLEPCQLTPEEAQMILEVNEIFSTMLDELDAPFEEIVEKKPAPNPAEVFHEISLD